MTNEQFVYWLQGYVEITNGQQPDALQWLIIRDHLSTVFHKVTPDRYALSNNPDPKSFLTSGCGVKPHDPTLPASQIDYCGGGILQARRFDPAIIGEMTPIDRTC